jgi:tetratricopeptide (TPR) repeat protein
MSDTDQVLKIYQETLALQRQLGEPKEIANALYNYALARIFGVQDPSEISRALDEAETIYRELGDVGGLGDVEWARGNSIAHVDDDMPTAIEHMKRSIDYYRQAGNELGMGWGMFEVGEMARRVGDVEQARPFIIQGLSLFAEHRDVSGVVLFIAAAAGLALDLGDLERAYRLAGAFHGLRITSGTEIVRSSLNQIEGLEFEILEAQSGEEAIPYREGRAMTFDQAVAYALGGPTDH